MNFSFRKLLAALALTGVIVASSACGVDHSTGSSAVEGGESRLGTSSFTPTASKVLFAIPNGVYTFTVQPRTDALLNIGGTSRLYVPADGICSLVGSGYGPTTWDAPCTPTNVPVVITVKSTGAGGATPRLEFQPALRFNPKKSVTLFMFGKNVTRAEAASWAILYCPASAPGGTCINEADKDRSLTSYVDPTSSVVFRRIKHFSDFLLTSGYVILD